MVFTYLVGKAKEKLFPYKAVTLPGAVVADGKVVKPLKPKVTRFRTEQALEDHLDEAEKPGSNVSHAAWLTDRTAVLIPEQCLTSEYMNSRVVMPPRIMEILQRKGIYNGEVDVSESEEVPTGPLSY